MVDHLKRKEEKEVIEQKAPHKKNKQNHTNKNISIT